MSVSKSTPDVSGNAEPSFWRWMAESGLRRFWNRWLIVHALVGAVLAVAVPGRLSNFAGIALMPLASLLVGLTFAWSANAASLLQTDEVQRIGTEDNGKKYLVFVFTYQGALFLVLATATIWSLIAGGVIDQWLIANLMVRHAGRTLLFALSSLTIRECWHSCVGVQQMLLSVRTQRSAKQQAEKERDGAVDGRRAALPARAERADHQAGEDGAEEHAAEEEAAAMDIARTKKRR